MAPSGSEPPTHRGTRGDHDGPPVVTFSMQESSVEELVDPQLNTTETRSSLQSEEPNVGSDKLSQVPSVKAIREALVGCNAPTDLVHYVVGAVHSYETLLRRLATVIESRERLVQGQTATGSADHLTDANHSLQAAAAAETHATRPGATQQPFQIQPDQVLYSPSSEFSSTSKHPEALGEEHDLETPKPHLPGAASQSLGHPLGQSVASDATHEHKTPPKEQNRIGHMPTRSPPTPTSLKESGPAGVPRAPLSYPCRGAASHSGLNKFATPGLLPHNNQSRLCATQAEEEPGVATASRSHQTEGHWATRFGRVFVRSASHHRTTPLLPASGQRGEQPHVIRTVVTPEHRNGFAFVHRDTNSGSNDYGAATAPGDRNYAVGPVRTFHAQGNSAAQPYSNTFQEQRCPLQNGCVQKNTAVLNAEPHGYMIHARPVTPFVQMPEYQDLPLPTVQPLGLPDRRRCRWGLQKRRPNMMPLSEDAHMMDSSASTSATLFGRAPSPPEYCNFLPQLFCCCNSG